MASIERRQRGSRSAPVRWRVRWRDEAGRSRSKTFEREDEARRFRVRLDGDLAAGTWVDPALSKVTLGEWSRQWRDTESTRRCRPTCCPSGAGCPCQG